MAFAAQASLQTLHSHLATSGFIPGGVQIGEPKEPVKGIFAAVYMVSASVVGLFLDGGTEELHVVNVRLYEDMKAEPQEDIEFRMAKAVSEITSDFIADYTLGTEVRHIDIGGINGTPMSAEWGYTDLGGLMYRTVDITVPLTVDDSATAAP